MSIEVFNDFGEVLAKVYEKTISCYTDGPEDINCVYLYDYTKDKDVEIELDVYNITKEDLYWYALEYFQAEELNYCQFLSQVFLGMSPAMCEVDTCEEQEKGGSVAYATCERNQNDARCIVIQLMVLVVVRLLVS